ncbi:hypothetical protein B0H11DRAFT_2024156 [Mycena galericulata]|nr:hypothetical protein B0H11DRAFT_2024156 [Mycena galericulata]
MNEGRTRGSFEVPCGDSLSISLSSFPAEILGEIFLASIPPLDRTGDPRAFFPWLLSHVCRHWRGSALAFAKLWSFLDLEQTQKNQDRHSASVHRLEVYLQRSGQRHLTFRLAYSPDAIHGHPFLECLLEHSARWKDVHIERCPPALARGTLARCSPSDFPSLRSLALSDCSLNSHDRGLVRWIPWSQLKRYHEYGCWWGKNHTYQWSTLAQLTSVVDLRAEFEGVCQGLIPMPNLRFASIVIDVEQPQGLTVEGILNSFALPQLKGLRLSLTISHHSHLKSLTVLRLSGTVMISNVAVTCILTELTELTDFTAEPHSLGIDAEHSVLVPKLHDRQAAALFAMIRARFNGILGLFSLYIIWEESSPDIVPAAMGWNVQVGLYEEFL